MPLSTQITGFLGAFFPKSEPAGGVQGTGEMGEITEEPIQQPEEDITVDRAGKESKRTLLKTPKSSMAEAKAKVATKKGIPHVSRDPNSTITNNQSSGEITSAITAHYRGNSTQETTAMKKAQDKRNVEKYIPETHLSERIEKEQAAKLEYLQAELEQINLERSKLRSELDKSRKAQSKMAHEYNMRHGDLQSKIQRLLRQLQDVVEEREELKTSHAHLQQTLGEIQERAFRSMNNGGWIAPEDAKVRDNLSRLQENIKKWAKNSSFQAFDDQHSQSLSLDQKQEIMRSMSNYCSPNDLDQLVQIIPPDIAKRIPYLFTHAMLSKDIFENIIENPFFTLELQGQTSFPTTAQLSNLYQTMIEIDRTEAHIWRSQMLRLLQAPDRVSKSDIVFTGRLQANLSQMGAERAEKFLRGPVRYLLDQSSGDERLVQKALADIYCYAGQLALSLWTQRSYLLCLNLQHITHFFAGRDEMSAHRLHRLDEEDTRLDGQPILVIVQPAAIAFGNDNAESYDQHKVWAEAVALVDERT